MQSFMIEQRNRGILFVYRFTVESSKHHEDAVGSTSHCSVKRLRVLVLQRTQVFGSYSLDSAKEYQNMTHF